MVFETVKFLIRVAGALVRRPSLLPTALRLGGALAPQKWWTSGSRLPFPRADYLEFRNVTLSGEADQMAEPHEVIAYLEWCKSMRALPDRG